MKLHEITAGIRGKRNRLQASKNDVARFEEIKWQTEVFSSEFATASLIRHIPTIQIREAVDAISPIGTGVRLSLANAEPTGLADRVDNSSLIRHSVIGNLSATEQLKWAALILGNRATYLPLCREEAATRSYLPYQGRVGLSALTGSGSTLAERQTETVLVPQLAHQGKSISPIQEWRIDILGTAIPTVLFEPTAHVDLTPKVHSGAEAISLLRQTVDCTGINPADLTPY